MTINIPNPPNEQERIVIVGGGFAGINLATKISKSDYQVVLIDQNNYHQFQPLFYQVAMAGLEPSSIVFPLRKTFQKRENTFIRVAKVESIDPKIMMIETDLGTLTYDHLVIGIGADTNFFGNEKIAEHAIPMKSVSEALFLRNAILDDYEKALVTTDYEDRQELIDIVIVGGGPTGVEVAGSLAEMKKYVIPKDYPELDPTEIDIHLFQGSDKLLEGMSQNASDHALSYLQNLGVKVHLNSRVTDFDGKTVVLMDGTTIPAKKVIWAAGIKGNTIKGISDEAITKGNRIKVDRYHQVVGLDRVYAVGDVCFMEEPNFPNGHPQVAQVAIQQGRNLARNFIRRNKGKIKKPFEYKDLGSMATIGRHLAVVDLPNIKMNGFFAWVIWLFVHLFQLLGIRNRVIVFFNWVWNYFTYDQSLRLIIKPKVPGKERLKQKQNIQTSTK